jgi:hypothetical protein
MPNLLQIKRNQSCFSILMILVAIIGNSSSYAQESEIGLTQTTNDAKTKVISPLDSSLPHSTKTISAQPTFIEPISQLTQHKQDIQHYQIAVEVRPLLVGTDEYITIIKKQTSINNKGVMILLPDWQQGINDPKAVNYLLNTLPALGWNTIAIQPDNKPTNFPSMALTTDDQTKENKLNITAYKNKLSALLNAIMNIAKQYPGIVVVIAQGNNAALLVELYEKESTDLPNALIMLSSFRESNPDLVNDVNEKFAQQIAQNNLPILDLYLRYDNPIVLAKAEQRKQLAKQAMKTYYRQRQLNNTATGYYPSKELIKQITGWLKVIGW